MRLRAQLRKADRLVSVSRGEALTSKMYDTLHFARQTGATPERRRLSLRASERFFAAAQEHDDVPSVSVRLLGAPSDQFSRRA